MLLAGCRQGPSSPDVVASSTLGEVRKTDLDAYVLTLPEARRGPAAGQEPSAWRRSLVEELLVVRALEAEGAAKRLVEQPRAVAFLQQEVEALLVAAVKERRLAAAPPITDADVRAFYDAHPKEVSHQGQVRLRHIFRRVDRDAPRDVRDAARREMNELLREIRTGASFEELARTRSDSETAPQGGLIGRMNHGDLGASVERIVWKLKEGEVSEVVGTPVGFHIFRVDTHIPPYRMEFAEALPRLRKRLGFEATDRTLKEQVGELVKASGAVYLPEAATSGAPDAVVFSLGPERLTRAGWEAEVAGWSFAEQRALPMADLLDAFVGDKLRLWEARRLKLEEDPAIAPRIAALRQDAVVRLAREERLREALRGKQKELEDFYQANQARFMSSRLHRVRLLTLDFPASGVDYGVYERLKALGAEIRAGRTSFADAAREISTDPSAPRGGDVGTIRLDAFGEWAGPRAYAKIEKVAVGEVSDPILVERYDRRQLTYDRKGYMLVRIEEVQEPRVRPYAEVQEAVAEEYVARDAAGMAAAVQKAVLDSIRARIHDRNL